MKLQASLCNDTLNSETTIRNYGGNFTVPLHKFTMSSKDEKQVYKYKSKLNLCSPFMLFLPILEIVGFLK